MGCTASNQSKDVVEPKDKLNSKKGNSFEVQPFPGYVIKTKSLKSNEKLFINVFHHYLVDDEYPINDRITVVDKKGDTCIAYGIVIPTVVFERGEQLLNSKEEAVIRIMNDLNRKFPDIKFELENVKLPKIKKGYVGKDLSADDRSDIPKFAIISSRMPVESKPVENNDYNNETVNLTVSGGGQNTSPSTPAPPSPIPSVASSEPVSPQNSSTPVQSTSAQSPSGGMTQPITTPNSTQSPGEVQSEKRSKSMAARTSIVVIPGPPKMVGWMRKRGHVVMNWKTRYFVLNNGYLSYYVEKLDTPPFGKNLKGQLCLAGFRVKPVAGSAASTRINLVFGATIVEPSLLTYLRESGNVGSEEGHAEDLLLEAVGPDETAAWLAAIESHTLYVETASSNAFNGNSAPRNNVEDSENDQYQFQFQGVGDFTQEEHDAVIDNSSSEVLEARSEYDPLHRASFSSAVTTNTTATQSRPQRTTMRSSVSNINSQKWTIFLEKNEEIMYTGIVAKPNPLGFIHLIRELVLIRNLADPTATSTNPINFKRLIYIDSNSYEMKGEIPWSSNSPAFPKIKKINNDTFQVVDHKGKSWTFIPKDGKSVDGWITNINGIPPV